MVRPSLCETVTDNAVLEIEALEAESVKNSHAAKAALLRAVGDVSDGASFAAWFRRHAFRVMASEVDRSVGKDSLDVSVVAPTDNNQSGAPLLIFSRSDPEDAEQEKAAIQKAMVTFDQETGALLKERKRQRDAIVDKRLHVLSAIKERATASPTSRSQWLRQKQAARADIADARFERSTRSPLISMHVQSSREARSLVKQALEPIAQQAHQEFVAEVITGLRKLLDERTAEELFFSDIGKRPVPVRYDIPGSWQARIDLHRARGLISEVVRADGVAYWAPRLKQNSYPGLVIMEDTL